ncbi:MAG: helix-turn-helix transcriptional regulator [Phycisphaerae bacterium]|nr:helix-turn-helix transcriptional regulator [Phycisphaerae bacterium]
MHDPNRPPRARRARSQPAGPLVPSGPEPVRIRPIHEGVSIQITSYACCKADCHAGDEEQQPGHVIVFPHAGVFVKHHEGTDVVVDANSCVFFNHPERYRTSHPYGFGDRGSAIVIAPELLLEIVASHDASVETRPERPFPLSHCPCDGRSHLLVRVLTHLLERGEAGDAMQVEETAIELVDRVVGAACQRRGRQRPRMGVATARAHRAAADAVAGLLARRFDEPWRLEDIARVVHVSPHHLCRVFRAQTGQTIHAYLNRFRLRHALDQLGDRSVTLTHLATRVGFASHSHFTQAFRREFGITPSVVRRVASLREMRRLTRRAG